MTFDAILEKVTGRFPGVAIVKGETKPDPYIGVPKEKIVDVVKYLAELGFESLHCISGVDYPATKTTEVVYHVASFQHRTMIALKVILPRGDGQSIPTLCGVYRGANWLEREVFDMNGVTFEGHPDMRRILCPEDWVGYPLKKDYVTPDYYKGMPVPLYFPDEAPADVGTPAPAGGGH